LLGLKRFSRRLKVLHLTLRRNRLTTYFEELRASEACRKRKPNKRLHKLKQEGRKVVREREACRENRKAERITRFRR
jgi:hypothetical protein